MWAPASQTHITVANLSVEAPLAGIKNMKKIKIVEDTTEASFARNSFIYDFMSSMRQKINDPLGVRAKKREEINRR